MNIQKLWVPVKREIWEYKVGLLWTPAVIALLIIVSVLYVAIANDYGSLNVHSEALTIESAEGKSYELSDILQFLALSSEVKDTFISYFAAAVGALLAIPMVLVLLVYGHSALFDDRKNRDILFWRSMPVSETQNVLTKLFIMGVVAPTVIFVLTLACVVTVLLIDICSFAFVEHWQPISIFASLWWPVKIYGGMLFYFIMLFPLYAWVIFSSAFARKSPFLVSSLIPAMLITVDVLLRKYLVVDLHIVSGLQRYIDFLDDITAKNHLVLDAHLVSSFAVAMLVGGVLVLTSIWLRNNRYEI
ncbi:MAG TPA: hypothetical protein VN030_03770 [Cellvibrio sp.]|nr:hypothetical protein [Cellvibrio sp.]